MKWIAVKDKMPPPDTKVLCISAHGVEGPEIFTLHYSRVRGWYSFELNISSHYIITYWCPMPSVPDDWGDWEYLEELLSP